MAIIRDGIRIPTILTIQIPQIPVSQKVNTNDTFTHSTARIEGVIKQLLLLRLILNQ
jgi:hypothetical protein